MTSITVQGCAQEKSEGKPLVSSFEQAIITTPPLSSGFEPFYKKYTDAFGIPADTKCDYEGYYTAKL